MKSKQHKRFNNYNTIEEGWKAFEKIVLDPVKAGPVQRQETKRAFYAAFALSLEMMSDIAEIYEDEDIAANHVEVLWQEVHKFRKDVQEGKA